MQKPTILYIDDELNNLNAFVATFRRHYNILTALSGKEAMAIMEKQPVQVIVTDQKMPEMTGTQFLEAIMPIYPDVMRIILTGFSDMEALVRAINCCRIFRYLTKPWNEIELKEAIDAALMTYAVEQGNKELLLYLKSEVEQQNQMIEKLKSQVSANAAADK